MAEVVESKHRGRGGRRFDRRVARPAGTPHLLPAPEAQPAELPGVDIRLDNGSPIRVVVADAKENPALRSAYARCQLEAYAAQGTEGAKSVADTCEESLSHVVVALDRDQRAIGGIKIHNSLEGGLLPVEAALHDEPRVRRYMKELRADGVMELSGTAVIPEVQHCGIAPIVIRLAVAALTCFAAETAMGFGHRRVLPLYRGFGFVANLPLGEFAYPDERFRSMLAVLADIRGLDTVPDEERARILAARRQIAHLIGIPERWARAEGWG